mgnify:CR=1 FL=1
MIMSDNRKYQIIISDRAKRMLAEHIRFLAKVNPESARKKKQQIIGELRSLSVFPQRFPFFEDSFIPHNKYHKMYIENRYLVLYQIKDNTVVVDYILDCRKDYNWLL